MIRVLALALLFCAACAPTQRTQVAPEPADLAFTHVNVIDVETGDVLPEQTVLIARNRIQALGPSSRVPVPLGAQVVEARGKYLIPGLVDTHVHRWWSTGTTGDTVPLFGWLLANGVTSMREAGGAGRERELVQLRERIERGEMLAPRLYVSGVASTKNVGRYGATDLRDLVRRLGGLGIDGIKVIHLTTDETSEAIEEARRIGLPAYGHTHVFGGAGMQRPDLPFGFQGYARDAVASGLSGVMHVTALTPTPGQPPSAFPADGTQEEQMAHYDRWWTGVLSGWLRMREGEMDDLVQAMVRQGTWLEPTLIFDDVSAHPDRYQDHPGEAYLGMSLTEWRGIAPLEAEQLRERQRVMARLGKFVRRFHAAGGLVLTGSDNTPVPGFGLHDELVLLVEAGLSPLAALQAATRNPAHAFGREDRLGTIQEGKLADLVLLEANPLEDITHTRKISAVVMNGRYLDRKVLDELLARVDQLAR